MCRLFGFRSVLQSQVHRSLVGAENALAAQSVRHPDGWGVAYYQAGAPHVIKSTQAAVDDHIFRRVSGVVSSETVLAHLRKATVGDHSIVNIHPFQFGRWVFAHNGNLAGFDALRPKLLERVPPVFRRFILGDTDSELLFMLLISKMADRCDPTRRGFPLRDLFDAIAETVEVVESIVGPICEDPDGPPTATYLTFVVTNGTSLAAYQGGKPLHVSTHKTRCPERDVCPSFAPECEAPTERGFVNHFIVSSEPLMGENVWRPLALRQTVGVDFRMQVEGLAA